MAGGPGGLGFWAWGVSKGFWGKFLNNTLNQTLNI
jgi:hypothetical protein